MIADQRRRRGATKAGVAAFEDAWLGHAVHALLPRQPAMVNITIVGLHRVYTFDTYGLKLNNYSMLVHDQIKHPLRTRWIHYYATRWHCDSEATLLCQPVQPVSHLGRSGRQYSTFCEVAPALNGSCKRTFSTFDLKTTYQFMEPGIFWPNVTIRRVGRSKVFESE